MAPCARARDGMVRLAAVDGEVFFMAHYVSAVKDAEAPELAHMNVP